MQVKCRWCGKMLDKKDAFQSPAGGGRFYFCDEEEANKKEAEKQNKIEEKQKKKTKKIDPIYEEIADIFGYRVNNSILFKEMKLWKEIADNEKILAYLQENKDYITKAIGRLDSSEFAKIRYFSAILKNSLHDFNKKVSAIEPIIVDVDCEIYKPMASARKKRRGLNDIEDEV